MQNNQVIQSVSYILGGALLQMSTGIGNSYAASLAAILGFFIFLTGLNRLKNGLDEPGQAAVNLLVIASLIGAASGFFSMIPFFGILSGIGFSIAFALELVGLIRLKNSNSIGEEGKGGTVLLVLAMILAILASIVGMIPLVGDFIASFFALTALGLVFIGWMKVQKGILETVPA